MLTGMRTLIGTIIFLFILSGNAFSSEKGLTIKGIRYFSYPTFTRIVFEAEAAAPYVLTKDESARVLLFSAYDKSLVLNQQAPIVNDGVIKKLEDRKEDGAHIILIHLDSAAGEIKDFVLRNPDRIVIDVARRTTAGASPAPASAKSFLIVIDPGHGGKDSGMVFAQGPEKNLTLLIAQNLRKRLKKTNPHAKVVFTREKDQELSLDDRAVFSNSAGAVLFLSIHLGSGNDMRVYVNELESEPVQRAPASGRDFLGIDTETTREAMIWGRQQAVHARESYSLARKIVEQKSGAGDVEPIQVPLAQLGSVDAAAVMVEVGAELDRARIAEDLAKGIEQYVGTQR